MKIDWYGSPNFDPSRFGQKVECVVLHWMGGTLYACDSHFKNPSAKVSAHYGIGGNSKREIHQYVKLEHTAWHGAPAVNPTAQIVKDKGAINPNFYSIGIEMEGGYNGIGIDPSTVDECSWLVAQLYVDGWIKEVSRYTIIMHKEINPFGKPLCPNLDINNFLKLVNDKVKQLRPEPPKPPVEDNKTKIKKLNDENKKLANTILSNCIEIEKLNK